MVYPNRDAKLRSILQKELDRFCAMNNIDKTILFLNKDGQKDRFIKQLEERPEILELCESPKILRFIVDDITFPF